MIKKYFYILLFAAIPIITLQAQTNDSLANYYYNQGLAALNKKNYDTAKDLLKKSVNKKESALAEYQLARVYRADTTHWSWNLSREHIKKAIKLDPNNPEYHLFYGLLAEDLYNMSRLEFDTINDAVRQYEKTVELDSTNVIAWERLAKIKSDDFYNYHNSGNMDFDKIEKSFLPGYLQYQNYWLQGRTRIKQVYDIIAEPVVSLESFAQKEFPAAEKALKETIKYKPSDPEAYFQISSLYEDNNMPEKAIPFLKKLLEFQPDNKDAHLNLGLIYYEVLKLDSSYSEYKKAIEEMPSDEKEDFLVNSVKILLEPLLGDKLKGMSEKLLNDVIKEYWRVRDPLNLTDYNERLLEHYSRVAYANLRFSITGQHIKGWQTDRGEIIIRYGFPKSKIILRADVTRSNKNSLKTHIWKYNDKTFAFVSSSIMKNARLAEPGEGKYWDDSKQLAKDLGKTNPDDYSPKFEGTIFTVPNAAYQFKNFLRNNFTDLFVSYGLKPKGNINTNNDYEYKHTAGIFLFDQYFNKLTGNRSEIDYLSGENKIAIPDSGALLINTREAVAEPDSGYLSFEVMRDSDKGVSAYHGKFNLRSFNSSLLEMSDVILASQITRGEQIAGRINRKDYSILSNPTGIFSKDQELYIYYEVYNLAKNEKGLTDFQQTIILQKKGEEGISIGKLVGSVLRFVGINKEEQQIGLTSKYQTKDKDSQVYLQLDMSGYDKGDYVLTVKIKDNISGKEVSENAIIKWI